MSRWPFADSERVAALTTRDVVERRAPILVAFHYADDGMWQFSSAAAFDDADARVVSLRELFDLDPTIAEVADLPPG
jgi:hypothetical protein